MDYYKKRTEAARRQRVIGAIDALCDGTGDHEDYPNHTIKNGICVYVNPDLGHCVSLTFAGEFQDIQLRDIADGDGLWAILDSLLFTAPPSSREVFEKTEDWIMGKYVVVCLFVTITDFENQYGIRESDLAESWFELGQCENEDILNAFEGQEWDYNGTWDVRAVLFYNEAQESSEAHLPPEIPAHYEVGYMTCSCVDYSEPEHDEPIPMSPTSDDPDDILPF